MVSYVSSLLAFLLAESCSAVLFHSDGEELQLNLLQRAARKRIQSLWVTDFHIDPDYLLENRECKKKNVSLLRQWPHGIMGCDPPWALASSVVEAMGSPAAEFVLSTGDHVRHHVEWMTEPYGNVSEVIRKVAAMVHERRPEIDCFFGALGNDDSVANYFQTITTYQVSNPWFRVVADELEASHCLSHALRSTYEYGGFYELRRGKFTILSIETVIYSVRHTPQNWQKDPFYQFAWLRERLAAAAQEKRNVWIVGHIPPGMESFGYTELWHPDFVQQYLDIVQDELLGGVIALQLFGHVHKDEIRLLPEAPKGAGPIFLSSSVSPVFYNNPSFKTVTFDDTGRLLNLNTHYAPLSNASVLNWVFGYGFTELYHLQKPDQESLAEMTSRLLKGEETWISYAQWYTTLYPNDLIYLAKNASDTPEQRTRKWQRRQQYVCALTIRSAASYQSCVDTIFGADLGSAANEQPLVDGVPRSFSEGDYLFLCRLLRWAELSRSRSAGEIRRQARDEAWEQLLERYGPKVEQSLELGVPLDELLN